MTVEIHVGDIGTIFEVTLVDEADAPIDVSSAVATKNIVFSKPNGTQVIKPAAFKTDGTDAIIQYTTVSGDLNAAGGWRLQGHVVLATGEWRSAIGEFVVEGNL